MNIGEEEHTQQQLPQEEDGVYQSMDISSHNSAVTTTSERRKGQWNSDQIMDETSGTDLNSEINLNEDTGSNTKNVETSKRERIHWLRIVLLSVFPLGFVMIFSFTHSVQLTNHLLNIAVGRRTRECIRALISVFYAVSLVVGASLVGYCSDHLRTPYGRRKPFIFFGSLATVVIFVLRYNLSTGGVAAFLLNVLLICLQNWALAMAMVSYLSLILDCVSLEQIGKLSTIYAMMNVLGLTLATPLFGNAAFTIPPFLLVLTICSITIVSTLLLLIIQEEPKENISNNYRFSYILNDDTSESIAMEDSSNKFLTICNNIPIIAFEYLKPLASRNFILLLVSWLLISFSITLFNRISYYFIQANITGNANVNSEFISFWCVVYLVGFVFVPITSFILDTRFKRACLFIPAIICAVVSLSLCLIHNYVFLWITGFAVGPAIATIYAASLTLMSELIYTENYHATCFSMFYIAQLIVIVLINWYPGDAMAIFHSPKASIYVVLLLSALLAALSATLTLFSKFHLSNKETYSGSHVFNLYDEDEYGISKTEAYQQDAEREQDVLL